MEIEMNATENFEAARAKIIADAQAIIDALNATECPASRWDIAGSANKIVADMAESRRFLRA
jgi:hypothetical protein